MSLLGNMLGVRMNLLIGPSPVALPAPADVLNAIVELEIKLSDSEDSGLRLVINAARSGPLDFLMSPFIAHPQLQKGARVIVTMVFDITPYVIFDGIVTTRDIAPGSEPRSGTLTLLARDLSWELDKEVRQTEHPAMDETMIAMLIAASYPQFGMIPMVLPPLFVDPPIPIDRVPQQNASDWGYLQQMAQRHGYETYIDAGPVPGVNTLYWGPPNRPGVPQRTITVDMGPASDAFNVTASESDTGLTTVETSVVDRFTGQEMPVIALVGSNPPLGAVPETVARFGQTRKVPITTTGLNAAQAMGRAQAEVDRGARDAFTVSGTLNSTAYNAALKARDMVFLRGTGLMQDGLYTVSEVRHRIKPGGYEQGFKLRRGERGPMTPLVMP
ncbi:hypothetical protein [Sphingomonas sp. KR3-1]|uniref:phage late control D family protein n=1 Tax=Sphingomonas sp. KR3-1 TaxID=3156611 RepID=UPI0032B34458